MILDVPEEIIQSMKDLAEGLSMNELTILHGRLQLDLFLILCGDLDTRKILEGSEINANPAIMALSNQFLVGSKLELYHKIVQWFEESRMIDWLIFSEYGTPGLVSMKLDPDTIRIIDSAKEIPKNDSHYSPIKGQSFTPPWLRKGTDD